MSQTPAAVPLPFQLSRMLMSVWVPAAISAAATLGLPDHLGEGPKRSDDVAKAAGANPGAIRRLLRALVVLELCTETDDGTFQPHADGHRPALRRARLDA